MMTVAEGVETSTQLREFSKMGCIETQGSLFSPPRPAGEILPSRNELRNLA